MHEHQLPAQFWTDVEATCEALHADIYLPSDVEAHLQNNPFNNDPSNSYNSQLRTALESARPLFHPHNVASQAENAFRALDTQLEDVEEQLMSLISSLEQSSASLRHSADHRTHLRSNAIVSADEARHITEFVEALVLSDNVQTVIRSSNPHSDEFKHALETLSQALTSCDLRKSALLVQKVQSSVMSLRDVAIRRIDERFRESLRLMRDPSSSFMILRDTLLLKQKPLILFLSCHRRTLFDSLTKEYVKVAKLAFDVHMRSYYSLLESGATGGDILVGDWSSVGDRTSKLLSSIWDYASAVPNPSDGELNTQGISESAQHRNEKAEDIKHLSDRCVDALQNSLNPPLTEAEIRLKGNTLIFPLSRLFRELAASFLNYEKRESQFVRATFDVDGREFLPLIFSEKCNPVLACLEESIQNSDSRSKSEELCLSLYVCRRIRESVTTQQGVDHRVTFFVLAERMIQTRLLSLLESAAGAAREVLLQESSQGVTENTTAVEMMRFSSLVSNLLVIAQQGDKWIHSQDVGYALHRRLHSCISRVLATADTIELSADHTDLGIKASLRCSTRLLVVLDICTSLEPRDQGTEEIRRLVANSFSHGCNAYAKAFEDRNLKEITQLESLVSRRSLDESENQFAVLLNKLSQTERMVRESMSFLADENVENVYNGEAVQRVLNSLRFRTDALKRSVSAHRSEWTDMLDW